MVPIKKFLGRGGRGRIIRIDRLLGERKTATVKGKKNQQGVAQKRIWGKKKAST
jgi:hypothetical protein